MTTTTRVTESELAERLAGLQRQLAEVKKQRQIRAAIGMGGFVAAMLIVGVFLFRLQDYVARYPADELTRALGREADALSTTPQALALLETIRDEAMHTVAPAVAEKFQAQLPRFREEGERLAQHLERYLTQEITERATQNLTRAVESIHATLLREFGHLPEERIRQATQTAQADYLQGVREVLQRHVQRSAPSVNDLQTTLARVSQDPRYGELRGKSAQAVQEDFYAAVLELALYTLKPERGEAPAR